LLFGWGAAGTPKADQAPATPAAREGAQTQRFAEMEQMAKAFRAATTDGDKRTAIKISDTPLHRWTDPTREFSDSALWAWKASGRPVAVLTIELYPERWSLEFVSLTANPVEAADEQIRWATRKAGVEIREIPGAPAPGTSEVERLTQMRDLAKRFSAREFWDVTGRDYVLRLLPQPIDRYADRASGVVDGAMFIYANGTNPEVILLIEARRQGDGSAKWFYAAAPLTTAAPTLMLDRKDVWTGANKYGYLADEPYFYAKRPRK
jgi:hypothetical protein